MDPVAFERKNKDKIDLPICQLSKLRRFTYHAPNFKMLADILRHLQLDVSEVTIFDMIRYRKKRSGRSCVGRAKAAPTSETLLHSD